MKYCQAPLCHTYDTKDRKKGSKGNKTNQTRRRSKMYYGNGNFCSMVCMNDWLNEYIDRAVDTVSGRRTKPIILTANNAWYKRHRWSWNRGDTQADHFFYNMVTGEEIDITEQQFNDDNYTLNT